MTLNSNERHFHEADRHFSDGGRYPFHHEKQQPADCGVHSLNTYNHGRSPLSRDAYFDFAKGQALQRLLKWGQGVTDTQAALAGTGMADLAHAQTYQVGQKARYLHSELGSTKAIADRVECAFKQRNGSKGSVALADWKSEAGSKLTAIRDTLTAVRLNSGRTAPMSRTSESDVEDEPLG